MANMLKNLLGFLRLGDEDEYDDYVDDYEEVEPIVPPKRARREQAATAEPKRQFKRETVKKEEEPVVPKKEKTFFTERTNKVVPIRTTSKGMEVCILKPTSFEDSQDICDILLSGRAAVINLEGFDAEDAQRIMDFVSGCVYAISGKLHQISRYIFIISPENVDISGDYQEIANDAGLGVPTLNRDF